MFTVVNDSFWFYYNSTAVECTSELKTELTREVYAELEDLAEGVDEGADALTLTEAAGPQVLPAVHCHRCLVRRPEVDPPQLLAPLTRGQHVVLGSIR